MNKITLTPHHTNWQSLFFKEKQLLLKNLKPYVANIYHIGSTVIPGIMAKPIIDMIIEVFDFADRSDFEKILLQQGYSAFRRSIIPEISAIAQKQLPEMNFNAHFFEEHDPEIERHRNFVSLLTQNPELARRYDQLKQQLAKQYGSDMFAYTLGKTDLVHELDCQAKLQLQHQNMPSDLSIHGKKLLSPTEIYQAALLNHYLFITHFAQYCQQARLIRIPGVTYSHFYLPNAMFNHVLDICFVDGQFGEMQTSTMQEILQSSYPMQWWDSFCNRPDCLAAMMLERGAQTKHYQVMYHQFKKLPVKTHLRLERLLSKKDIQHYQLSPMNKASENYFKMIAAIPHAPTDAIQFYCLYDGAQRIGYFTLVFYAKVVGLYWFDTIDHEKYLGELLSLLQTKYCYNYQTLVTLFDLQKFPQQFAELERCGQMTAYQL